MNKSRSGRAWMRVVAASVVAGAVLLPASPSEGVAPVRTLTRLGVHDKRLVDAEGREVTLRGLVTLTANLNGREQEVPGDLLPEDYVRMREWGFNTQQIRVQGCQLGMGTGSECTLSQDYLQELDNMVTWAAAEGIYTTFKVTFYDIPSWFLQGLNPARWDPFWGRATGEMERFFVGWEALWQRMAGRPEVVGYDILNEPIKGTITGGPGNAEGAVSRFVEDHLEVLYAEAAARLRAIDADAVVFFQPMVIPSRHGHPMDAPGANSIFAPHLYPGDDAPTDGIPDDLAGLLAQLRSVADGAAIPGGGVGVPMHIGEYGWPAEPVVLVIVNLPARTQASDRAYADALDAKALGSTLPWYAYTTSWRVLNEDGSEDVPHMDTVSRPFVARASSPIGAFDFDFDAKELRATIPGGGTAQSEIFAAEARHYPAGFEVLVNGTVTPIGTGGLGYDAATETLVLQPTAAAQEILIRPVSAAPAVAEASAGIVLPLGALVVAIASVASCRRRHGSAAVAC